MKRTILPVLVTLGAFGIGACSDVGTEPSPALEFAAGPDNSRSPARTDLSIAQIAINEGFSELVGALAYVDEQLDAGLVDLFLNGKSQYTVFAPNNGAFEELYTLLSGVLGTTIDEITDIPAPIVLNVLEYHVTSGRRAANSVVPKNQDRIIETLQDDETFAVRKDGSIEDGLTGIREFDAKITLPDQSAFNGIVHGIDQVIVPPSVVRALTN